MKNNRLIKFLLNPPAVFLCFVWLVAILLIAGSVIIIAEEYKQWPSYVVFALSAVFLAYSVYVLVRFIPSAKTKIAQSALRHPFIGSILGNYGFRTISFAVASFAANVVFAFMNGVLGIITSSVWYGVFAVYYIALSALRGGMLAAVYKAKKLSGNNAEALKLRKIAIYRMCGIALLVLELALAAAVTLMVLADNPANYSPIMAIASAAYTFYKVIFALYNAFKVRRMHDAVLQSFRNINLTDAAVSLLALQVTLVAVFSEGGFSTVALNSVTGFVVCVLTIALGISMIVRSCTMFKQIKEGKN